MGYADSINVCLINSATWTGSKSIRRTELIPSNVTLPQTLLYLHVTPLVVYFTELHPFVLLPHSLLDCVIRRKFGGQCWFGSVMSRLATLIHPLEPKNSFSKSQ